MGSARGALASMVLLAITMLMLGESVVDAADSPPPRVVTKKKIKVKRPIYPPPRLSPSGQTAAQDDDMATPPPYEYLFPPPARLDQAVVVGLMGFKNSATFQSWNAIPNLVGWDGETDPCLQEWTGVVCFDGPPVELDFTFANLEIAQLPDSLSAVTTLDTISLSYNNIQGSLPDAWKAIEALMFLDVGSNSLTSSIPESWGSLPNIDQVVISSNPLMCGPVPTGIPVVVKDFDYITECPTGSPPPVAQGVLDGQVLLAALVEMEGNATALGWTLGEDACSPMWDGVNCTDGAVSALNLTGMMMAGSVPPSLANITTLTGVSLGHTGLNGPLPLTWSAMLALQDLSLTSNNIDGSLPAEYSSMGSLQVLDVSNNQITDSIPSAWPFGMVAINSIDLSSNPICGMIPPGFAGASRNVTINSDATYIGNSCDAPSPMMSPPPTQSVISLMAFKDSATAASWDAFGGQGWDWSDPCSNIWTGVLCDGPNPIGLDLSGAGLVIKQMTDSLSQITSLTSLALPSNNIEGVLPVSYSALRSLASLDVSHNDLSGSIPILWSRMASLSLVNIEDNPKMCGSIPSYIIIFASDPGFTECA